VNQVPQRSIGLATATSLVVGEMIGVGIFLTPAGMAKGLGTFGLVLAVWLGMGAAALCGALCYGELAARYPQSGGLYVYLREAFGTSGPRLAFLCGWMYLLVLDPGLSAALAIGIGAYAATLVPGLPARAFGIAFILAAATANAFGLKLAAGVTRGLAFVKVGLLVAIVARGFGAGVGDASRLMPFASRGVGAEPLLPALAAAIVSAFFSFGGWWDVAKVAGEVREPQRTLPRALAWGVAATTVAYVLTSAVFAYLVAPRGIGSPETFAAAASVMLFGSRGAQALSAVIILCIGSSLLAYMTAAPRVYYAMARDGLAVGAMGDLHPKTGAPLRAIAVQAVLASLLVAIGRFDQIAGYFVFTLVLFLAASVAGLFRLRRRGGPAAYSTPAFPLPAIGFLLMTVVVLVLLAVGQPLQAGAGVAVTALGIPVYAWLRSRKA